MDALSEPPPPSPCVGTCAYDPARGTCTGCGRTLDEIGAWSEATVAEKRHILAAVARRAARKDHWSR